MVHLTISKIKFHYRSISQTNREINNRSIPLQNSIRKLLYCKPETAFTSYVFQYKKHLIQILILLINLTYFIHMLLRPGYFVFVVSLHTCFVTIHFLTITSTNNMWAYTKNYRGSLCSVLLPVFLTLLVFSAFLIFYTHLTLSLNMT